ncbi:polyhydroxyalkanoate synthesis repressor PhaR [Salinisphaera hydrothermalis]|uniref:Polyhydroxyalkonate synthesis repressor PhaR n=1 Tax=Salinisphaera hydrothermalis (strain C41B8) TaxID=1304275 RepID=A0A084IJV4_SALHC|nr:polyhydroxyalkanoate synthesis repressor PhaR [Salinisphaera hydrothermalis]KEZ76988.1 polyhydroxyalkonate synthesis repressor PhaR [Salinisphaera hydrothermalis C41B8]
MPSERIIKKYPNRRLYDTEVSRYITLENIRQLVIANEDFKVVDKRSGRDITRSILLQVISEQEEGGNPIFRTEVLRNIIRFYGDSMQSTMSSYLELSLEFFNEQQSQFRGRLRRLLGANTPLAALRELSQDQLPIWRSVRREFLSNLARRDASPPQELQTTDEDPDTPDSHEARSSD